MKKISRKRRSFIEYIKKRFGDIRYLFRKNTEKSSFTDFELMIELRNEIVRLKLQDDLSMTKFRKLVQSPKLPSVDTIMKRTNKKGRVDDRNRV